jgi:hypothetical protein
MEHRAATFVIECMHKLTVARVILTAVLVTGVVASFMLDWSANHLFNPAWHGHARFHGALLLFLLLGVSATGLWLLWRQTSEPNVGITAAAAISASFWMPLFFITSVLPGSTAWAGDPNKVPTLAGHTFYPNLAVAAGFLTLTALAWRIARGSPSSSPRVPHLS